MALTADQFVNKLRNGSLKRPLEHTCVCGKVLDPSCNRWTADGYMCEDCYYEVLGELVECYPIAKKN